MRDNLRKCISLGILYAIQMSIVIITTCITTKRDAIDDTVQLERLSRIAHHENASEVQFNPIDYDYHCSICDTHVLENSKHC